MWAIRVLYCISFFVIVFTDNISAGFRDEIVQEVHSETYKQYSKNTRGYDLVTDLDITTNKSNYSASFRRESPPNFSKGDTLQIERDIFNKSMYFSKKDWDQKYAFSFPFDFILMFINLLLVIITLISFAFNDGLFKYNNWIWEAKFGFLGK